MLLSFARSHTKGTLFKFSHSFFFPFSFCFLIFQPAVGLLAWLLLWSVAGKGVELDQCQWREWRLKCAFFSCGFLRWKGCEILGGWWGGGGGSLCRSLRYIMV